MCAVVTVGPHSRCACVFGVSLVACYLWLWLLLALQYTFGDVLREAVYHSQ